MSQTSFTTTTITATRPRIARVATATALGVATLGIAAVPLLGVAAPALAHDELINSAIVLDPTDGSFEAVQLSFSDSIIETGAEMTVTDASGSDVTDGALEIAGPDVTQPLRADLPEGRYDGAWRVVSSDGHPIEGFFGITVAADGSVEIDDDAALEADSRFAQDEEGENAEAASDHDDANGAPVGAVIAVVVGGAAVIAGGITAATVGQRRRAKAMREAAERSGGGDPTTGSGSGSNDDSADRA